MVAADDLPAKIWTSLGQEKARPVPPAPVAAAGFAWPTVRDLEDKGMDLKAFLDEMEDACCARPWTWPTA